MDSDGDMAALLDGYRRRGFALALHMLGDPDDAADAVQDGLSALWRHRGEIRRRDDSAAWFFRVLRNGCIDRRRRAAIRRHESLDERVDTRAADPVRQAERNEFGARLRQELDRMEADQREILLLRDFVGLSYAQIGDVLSIRPGTVMSRIHRARMALRERLGDLL